MNCGSPGRAQSVVLLKSRCQSSEGMFASRHKNRHPPKPIQAISTSTPTSVRRRARSPACLFLHRHRHQRPCWRSHAWRQAARSASRGHLGFHVRGESRWCGRSPPSGAGSLGRPARCQHLNGRGARHCDRLGACHRRDARGRKRGGDWRGLRDHAPRSGERCRWTGGPPSD